MLASPAKRVHYNGSMHRLLCNCRHVVLIFMAIPALILINWSTPRFAPAIQCAIEPILSETEDALYKTLSSGYNNSEAKSYAEQQVLNGNGFVMFHHIHKAGGSSMCAYVKGIGVKTRMKDNCNIGLQDVQEDFAAMSLTDQKQFLKSLDVEFAAIEYVGSNGPNKAWFNQTEDFQIAYVINLRHPYSRFISQYHRMVQSYPGSGRLETLSKYLESFQIDWVGRLPKGPADMDNIHVRMLAGNDVMRGVPVGGVTLEHFQRAVAALDNYSVVLILEEIDIMSEQLKRKFGWDAEPLKHTRHNSNGEHNVFEDGDVDLEAIELMQKLSVWDLALYHYAYNKYYTQVYHNKG